MSTSASVDRQVRETRAILARHRLRASVRGAVAALFHPPRYQVRVDPGIAAQLRGLACERLALVRALENAGDLSE